MPAALLLASWSIFQVFYVFVMSFRDLRAVSHIGILLSHVIRSLAATFVGWTQPTPMSVLAVVLEHGCHRIL